MPLIYFGTRLSENISRREPEGYLICLNVPVARTGIQEYLPSELGLSEPDARMIPVLRPEEEVFSPACVASFEGIPVTDDHPSAPEGVTAENIHRLQKGHAHSVRRGTGAESDLLLADLIITDPRLIDEILRGKREISCGYNYTLCEEDGTFVQREIRGNHVAVVDAGRAGPRVSIRDREPAQPSGKAAKPTSLPAPGLPDSHSPDRPIRAPAPGADGQSGSPISHNLTNEQSERSNPMKKKSLWRAKLMARMARDGDVEGLAEIITEMMEEPAPAPAALPAEEAALPAADPLVSAVASAVAENLDPAAADEDLPANAAAGAPVVVETPTAQPVIVDCGPEILDLLRRIIGLLSGPAADCDPEARSAAANGDEEPAEAIEAAAEMAAEQMAEAAAQAAIGAVAGAAGSLDSDGPEVPGDPVEELVAEILDEEAEEAPAAGDGEEILSSILEPEAESDEDPEDPEGSSLAADALRAALASFRPQLRRMSPRERQRFNADVAARMRKLSAAAPAAGKPSPYAALRKSASRDQSGRSLGQKIMASRNANLRGRNA